MSRSEKAEDSIQLSLPLNAAYVSAARLTASSIANRIGFDIDEIEDIKTAVSEACSYIIKRSSVKSADFIHAEFSVYEARLEINIAYNAEIEGDDAQNEMSLMMIKALMDESDFKSGEHCYEISMVKRHKAFDFEF